MDNEALKQILVDTIEEYFSPNAVPMAKKWDGGVVTLKPGDDSQSKDVPIEVFFKKLLTVRDSLRVLEQKINSHPQLSGSDRATMHSYITKAYGTLTTFNILFKDGKDRFIGAGKGSGSTGSGISMSEAKRKLGINEY